MRTSAGTLLAFVLLAGCPSTTVYRTAEPVEPGRWQVGGALGLGAFSDAEQDTRVPTGHIELSARRGIAEGIDAGGKLYTFGAELNATLRVYRGEAWSWAVLPSIGGLRSQENGLIVDAIHLFAGLGAVASRPLSDRWTLGVGPFVGYGLFWPETGGSAQGGWLGGFAHADLKLGARWHLTPELGAYRVIAGEVPVDGGALSLGVSARRDL